MVETNYEMNLPRELRAEEENGKQSAVKSCEYSQRQKIHILLG